MTDRRRISINRSKARIALGAVLLAALFAAIAPRVTEASDTWTASRGVRHQVSRRGGFGSTMGEIGECTSSASGSWSKASNLVRYDRNGRFFGFDVFLPSLDWP
jgi:hypothetical protein